MITDIMMAHFIEGVISVAFVLLIYFIWVIRGRR